MKPTEIIPGFEAVNLTLHVPEYEALVFADIHLGYEEALNREGILVPHFQYKDVVGHVKAAIDETRPKRIIINGDLKHEFGLISAQEWREVMNFLRGLKGYDVTLVKGNHDTIVGPIASGGNIKLVEELKLGTTLFVHGHKMPENRRLKTEDIKTVVIGHEHPCIGLREDERVEKVKCFLAGKWKGRDLIVLPSMNFVTEGTDILVESLLSPLLKDGVEDYGAWGVDGEEILYFGKVGKIN